MLKEQFELLNSTNDKITQIGNHWTPLNVPMHDQEN